MIMHILTVNSDVTHVLNAQFIQSEEPQDIDIGKKVKSSPAKNSIVVSSK